jgi:hypothetical protein
MLKEDFGLGINGVNKKRKLAPDQNRTDTSSLEGYGSTIELQAQK